MTVDRPSFERPQLSLESQAGSLGLLQAAPQGRDLSRQCLTCAFLILELASQKNRSSLLQGIQKQRQGWRGIKPALLGSRGALAALIANSDSDGQDLACP